MTMGVTKTVEGKDSNFGVRLVHIVLDFLTFSIWKKQNTIILALAFALESESFKFTRINNFKEIKNHFIK